MKTMLLDEDAVEKLRKLAAELQAGTDRERDYGHRLWLVLKDAPVVDEKEV